MKRLPPKFNLTPEENRRALNMALMLAAMDIRIREGRAVPDCRPPKIEKHKNEEGATTKAP